MSSVSVNLNLASWASLLLEDSLENVIIVDITLFNHCGCGALLSSLAVHRCPGCMQSLVTAEVLHCLHR